MILHLKRPLVFFDLETTGANVSTDRIVELSFVKLKENEEIITLTYLINPQIPISVEASLVHGISDADVKDAPLFPDVAEEVSLFLKGCDLAGFNIIQFDIPILIEEFLRIQKDFHISDRNIIDIQKIFHLMEKRNLSGAYKFYCGKDLMNAHRAEQDARATLEIFLKQVEKYQGQEVVNLKGEKLGTIENDMDLLHTITQSNVVDFAGRIIRNEDGQAIFNFGKHKGKIVLEVLKKEPSFYHWMMRSQFPLDTKRKLTDLKKQIDEKK
ncbi:MAG: 3'-5' exonuclease [Chitinophagaceae bacterium]|nr:3'-5' exonuclease [Chitinophagaceae bacterium]